MNNKVIKLDLDEIMTDFKDNLSKRINDLNQLSFLS
jgi:5'(3')-deoxyribonucleotidase